VPKSLNEAASSLNTTTNENGDETALLNITATTNATQSATSSLRNTMTEKKQEFFDRIALVSSSLMKRERTPFENTRQQR
jgi:hypothetical protein